MKNFKEKFSQSYLPSHTYKMIFRVKVQRNLTLPKLNEEGCMHRVKHQPCKELDLTGTIMTHHLMYHPTNESEGASREDEWTIIKSWVTFQL